MEYKDLLARMSAGTNSTFGIIEFQLHLDGHWFNMIYKLIFLLPVCLISIAFGIVLFILSLIGKIIVFIPLIGFVYAIFFEAIHFTAFGIGFLGNITCAGDYIDFMSYKYREDYMNAMMM